MTAAAARGFFLGPGGEGPGPLGGVGGRLDHPPACLPPRSPNLKKISGHSPRPGCGRRSPRRPTCPTRASQAANPRNTAAGPHIHNLVTQLLTDWCGSYTVLEKTFLRSLGMTPPAGENIAMHSPKLCKYLWKNHHYLELLIAPQGERSTRNSTGSFWTPSPGYCKSNNLCSP